jgi:hypothetical protein
MCKNANFAILFKVNCLLKKRPVPRAKKYFIGNFSFEKYGAKT